MITMNTKICMSQNPVNETKNWSEVRKTTCTPVRTDINIARSEIKLQFFLPNYKTYLSMV